MSCAVAMASSPVFSPSSRPSSSSSSSFRIQTSFTGFRSCRDEESSSSSSSSSLLCTQSHPKLKRKRPARLDIPIVSASSATLSFTETAAVVADGRNDVIEEEKDEYALCCKKGRRSAMEDRFSAILDVNDDSKQAFFGIFDGHGGAKAAEFASDNIGKNILDEVKRREEEDLEDAVKHGYLKTDSDFLNEDFRGGSCCVTALIREGNLIVSNAGDCRAVMSRGGFAEALTSDHRPSREDEKDRIEALGGYVDFCRGVLRIQGSLAVSRGIGDRHLKQWVIAEPETCTIKIKPDTEFLILASDGLWDKVSNQEAVDIVRPLCMGDDKLQAMISCKKLVDLSISRGSLDDISVMLIQLGRYI